MGKNSIEAAAKNLITYFQYHGSSSRLEKHEAMKSFLFQNGLERGVKPKLEHVNKINGKSRRFDYSDIEIVIEIDDRYDWGNLEKLLFARKNGRKVCWIWIHWRGGPGKMIQQAKKYDIPLLEIRLYAKREPEKAYWKWLVPFEKELIF